jgi:sugar phosphate isomerase/epimerase
MERNSKMSKPLISVQLYSVREQLSEDYEGTIRKIAAMGYENVEPAGFPGTTPEAAVKLFKELGLKSLSFHGGLPLAEKKNEMLELAELLGAKYLFTGFGPPEWDTVDKIKAVADKFNEAAENAAAHGLKVGNHNHGWEMNIVDGRPAYEYFIEFASPEVLCQIDTYWVKVGGQDPVEVLNKVTGRAPVLHIKDGPGVATEAMLPVGDGIMDFPAIIATETAKKAEALVVEIDRCDTDMMDAVEKSCKYLSGLVK